MKKCSYCGQPAEETYLYNNGKSVCTILYCSAQHRAIMVQKLTPKRRKT